VLIAGAELRFRDPGEVADQSRMRGILLTNFQRADGSLTTAWIALASRVRRKPMPNQLRSCDRLCDPQPEINSRSGSCL
jgi:hypothetical protein